MDIETHKDLIKLWFADLKTRPLYQEPTLNEFVMDKIKLFCESLLQDSHVFQTTVELLERYISIKGSRKEKIEDPFLIILTMIYLSCKHIGDLSGFKTETFGTIYETLTQKKVSNEIIHFTEISILITLDYYLPLHSRIDDLKTFLAYYVKPMNLNFDLGELCEDLLNFYTVHSAAVFSNLKANYMQSREAYGVFIETFSNRMFLPIGVFLAAVQMTKTKNIFNLDHMVKELSEISCIHFDHLNLLADVIYKFWGSKTKNVKNIK